eukprot:gnl/Hemi2/17998_TR5943_c0_g1_i1.p1 gnl/Hemi2/17998_TR5943_c0_g1~~gnl/Hemi2/17998_TR5943_c0_g1_i1.p1  ORF type:complete len:184 (+),score=42.68 gnl/Hemi2/17998_TR5943_c0_g1_i1:74-553(+)
MAGRLMKEHRELQKNGGERDVLLYPDDGNILAWRATLQGPPDTPYAGGSFDLDISVPHTYPLVAPTVRFLTKIFHPNILFKTGEICLDVLKTTWSPAWTLQSVCRAIITLMAHPEPDSPLNCDCGNLLRCGDKRGYESLARMYTQLYASPPPPPPSTSL